MYRFLLAILALPFSHYFLTWATPKANLSDDYIKALIKRAQDGGTEVVEAKAVEGSATLSMACAGALFGNACLMGADRIPDDVECSFVQSSITELVCFQGEIGEEWCGGRFGIGVLSGTLKRKDWNY